MRSFTIAAAAASTLAGFAAAAAVASNSTLSGNNPVLFIDDGLDGQGSYAASIVNACKDQTVYALQCTSISPNYVGEAAAACGAAAPTLTLTEGPSVYIVNYVTTTQAEGHSGQLSATESCVISGTTAASCTLTAGLTVDGSSRVVSTSTIVSGTDFHRYEVSITGGADKTAAAATASCKPNGAAGVSPSVVKVAGAVLAIGLAGVLAL